MGRVQGHSKQAPGRLDDKIGVSRRMNETLEEMAQAPFESVLIGFPVLVRSERLADAFAEQIESPRRRVLESVEERRIPAAEREVPLPRPVSGEVRVEAV